MINLDNKIALITGSSDGIGAATALLFSSLGAKIAIVGRDATKLAKVSNACESKSPHGYKPISIQADFESDDDIKRTFEETINAFGKLDILINNAGIASTKAFGDPDGLAEYDRVMQVNVRSVIRLIELAKTDLDVSKGSIVNVSSIAALRSSPIFWSYSMSKAALDMLTKTMACQLAPNIRVNSVNPGPVRTNIIPNAMDTKIVGDLVAKTLPVQRIGEPEDIANMIAFLSSDASKNMTGSIVVSDSGSMIADAYEALIKSINQ